MRHALCRTNVSGVNNQIVAEVVQLPDTFSCQNDTAACNVLHEANPASANGNDVKEDTCVGSCRPLSVAVDIV